MLIQCDVVVCGLGVMGSAALHALARRGCSVVGIERFTPGHDRGSSHGETRIIRLAYFEHPSYVPLVRRAYALWREIEQAAGEQLLHVTGIAEIGPPDSMLVRGTLAAAQMHGLPHEVLSAAELMRRYPVFRLPADDVAVLQPDGGFLLAEPAVLALLELAKKAGAEVRSNETILAIEPHADGVRIVTERETIEAETAVVAAGAWLPSLLPSLRLPVRVTRQAMGWFAPADAAPFALGRFPVFLIESQPGVHHYGFPTLGGGDGGGGIKVARHHHADQAVDVETYDRVFSADDEALIRTALATHIPSANGTLISGKTCLYTVTPDGDFIIDRLPEAPQVIVASPCSGHGFKFAPAIGEILADLVTSGATAHDISRFSLGRFSLAGFP
jgi:sarcosine oxidase